MGGGPGWWGGGGDRETDSRQTGLDSVHLSSDTGQTGRGAPGETGEGGGGATWTGARLNGCVLGRRGPRRGSLQPRRSGQGAKQRRLIRELMV